MLADRAGRIAREGRRREPRARSWWRARSPPLFRFLPPRPLRRKGSAGHRRNPDRRPRTPCRCLARRDPRLDPPRRPRSARRSANDQRPFLGPPSLWRTAKSAMPPRLPLAGAGGSRRSRHARLEGRGAAFSIAASQKSWAAALDARVQDLSPARLLTLGVYANAFPPQDKDAAANAGLSDIRARSRPRRVILNFVQDWLKRGAGIVGGLLRPSGPSTSPRFSTRPWQKG